MPRRTLGAALAVLGALLLADAALTVLWREPVTWLVHRGDQAQLARRLEQTDRRYAALVTSTGTVARDVALADAAARLARETRPGDPLGRISIPRIGARFVVVQGTASAQLREGPGHYLPTALPGQPGTVGLAGHRTTYQQPFRSIDALHPGDRIVMTMPYGRFVYAVTGSRVVAPSQVGVLARAGGAPRIVLTACTPLFTATRRLVVTGRLVSATPRVTGVSA